MTATTPTGSGLPTRRSMSSVILVASLRADTGLGLRSRVAGFKLGGLCWLPETVGAPWPIVAAGAKAGYHTADCNILLVAGRAGPATTVFW